MGLANAEIEQAIEAASSPAISAEEFAWIVSASLNRREDAGDGMTAMEREDDNDRNT